jgi:hypothetical protein
LEYKGGRYLESMQEIGKWHGLEERRVDWTDPGYACYAYDEEKEDKLWALSEKLNKHLCSGARLVTNVCNPPITSWL